MKLRNISSKPEIGLFIRLSVNIYIRVLWRPTAETLAIDSFPLTYNYSFPSFSIISQTLAKTSFDRT